MRSGGDLGADARRGRLRMASGCLRVGRSGESTRLGGQAADTSAHRSPPLPAPASGGCRALGLSIVLGHSFQSRSQISSLPTPVRPLLLPSRSFISTHPHGSPFLIPPPLSPASAAQFASLSSNTIATLAAMVGSPLHPASLVDASLHSPALMELIEIEMGRNLIGEYIVSYVLPIRQLTYSTLLPEHLVDTVVETVDYALGRPSSSSRGRSVARHSEHSKFLKFVTDVIQKAEVKVPAILVTLVYINRAKPHIQIALEQWANERVFLGALILANKVCSLLPTSSSYPC